MVEFGCTKDLTIRLVRRLSEAYQLTEEQIDMLLGVVATHGI
jgi:hypothetical protein